MLRAYSTSGDRLYYHRNQQYSITAVTGTTGAIQERYAYTAYGEPTILDSAGTTVLTSSAYGNRIMYTGREWDVELTLYHYRARMYDPVSGRFVSRDPIGYEGSPWNLFRYALNSPLRYIDPLGLAPNQGGVTDPQHLLDLIIQLEEQGMSVDDILGHISDLHTSNDDRYFYTEEYGWVDIRHFGAAAEIGHGLGPAGSEISEFLGLLNECAQWYSEGDDDYHSGFSEEDLPSNSAGADFGEDYAGHYDTLAEAFEDWLNEVGGLPANHPSTGFPQLPPTDPSLPGGTGTSNSSNNPPGGVSNSDPTYPIAPPGATQGS